MKLTTEGTYRFTAKEHGKCLTLWVCSFIVIGWLFYDCPVLGIFGLVTYGIFYRISYSYMLHRYKRLLQYEFKDMMISVYSSLAAGATLEESIRRALADLERSLNSDARIVQELAIVCQKMERNIPIVQCLDEMSRRCDHAEMNSFFQVLAIGKRQGGNMPVLVRESVDKIQRRIEISHEIEGIIGAKRGEFLFMCLIPLGIIVYMRLFSPEFMKVLYVGMAGRVCMTGCLVLYLASVILGLAILKLD